MECDHIEALDLAREERSDVVALLKSKRRPNIEVLLHIFGSA